MIFTGSSMAETAPIDTTEVKAPYSFMYWMHVYVLPCALSH